MAGSAAAGSAWGEVMLPRLRFWVNKIIQISLFLVLLSAEGLWLLGKTSSWQLGRGKEKVCGGGL